MDKKDLVKVLENVQADMVLITVPIVIVHSSEFYGALDHTSWDLINKMEAMVTRLLKEVRVDLNEEERAEMNPIAHSFIQAYGMFKTVMNSGEYERSVTEEKDLRQVMESLWSSKEVRDSMTHVVELLEGVDENLTDWIERLKQD